MKQAEMEDHFAYIEQHVDKVEDWEKLPDDPLVSVCITTYNQERYVADAIEGALMQETDFPYEIVIAEDSSTDRTLDIVIDYQKRYPELIRVRVARKNLFEENVRYPIWSVYNSSRGKYIAFCEGDDYWCDTNKLQIQVDTLSSSQEYAGCFHKTKHIESDGSFKRVRGQNAPKVMSTKDTISTKTYFHTSSFMCKRKSLEWPKWSTKFISGDMIIFSIVSRSGKLVKVNRIMSVQRNREDSLTHSEKHVRGFHERRIKLMKKLNNYHDRNYTLKVVKVALFHKKEMYKSKIKSIIDKITMNMALRTRVKRLFSHIRE